MKKNILYLTEFLSKCDNEVVRELYQTMLLALQSVDSYTPSKYSQKQLQTIMHHHAHSVPNSFTEAIVLLDAALEESLPLTITTLKKQIFITLLASNFPKKKAFLEVSIDFFISQLEPVEKHIYDNLLSYILGLNRALGLFYILSDAKSSPEVFIDYGNTLHVKLFELIYNEEEQALLQDAHKELLGVYLSLYGKYLYM